MQVTAVAAARRKQRAAALVRPGQLAEGKKKVRRAMQVVRGLERGGVFFLLGG